MQRFSPRSEESEPHIRLPSLGALYQEDKPLEHLALRVSGAYFQEKQKAVGYRDSTLKDHTQNLTCSETQGKSSYLKEALVRYTC